MKTDTSPRKIEEVLTRGVANIYPSREVLEKVLLSGKKLRIYHGIDPTGPLHIGHMVALRKLRQFQDLGHEVIVLIGDFTATIGDPTDKKTARQPLTRKQVLENSRNYKKQIGKFLDLRKSNVRFLHNEKWTNKLKPADMLELASHFTVARLLERDMFQERIKAGREIYVHEFLYPLFQAYDSVSMGVDLEIGGSDQIFNMLAGRDLLKKLKNKEKFVLALKLLTDPSGKKMGKSEGNVVALDEEPGQMLGKIMSWPDSMISSGFEILTDASLDAAINPRDAKMKLAKEVVSSCYDEKTAQRAEAKFNQVFRDKELPAEIPSVKISRDSMPILDLLVEVGLASSKSDAQRLVEQGGVKIDGVPQDNWQKMIEIREGTIIRVGKRNFVRIAQ